MNIPFNTIEEFRAETKTQSQHFKNLSLNQYRKSIANRYGFKGITVFEEHIEKLNQLKKQKAIFEDFLTTAFVQDTVRVKEFVKDTTDIDFKSFSQVKEIVEYVFNNHENLSMEVLNKAFLPTNIEWAFAQGDEDVFDQEYGLLAKLSKAEQYIILWFWSILTIIESQSYSGNCGVINVCHSYGIPAEQLLPSEEKLYQFHEAVVLIGDEISVAYTELVYALIFKNGDFSFIEKK